MVELIVTHPLVNILRGAMSILVAIVSHPHTSSASMSGGTYNGPFGFRALKPAITTHTQFLEMLVNRLSSADHALCANSLQLINSLMRDAITNDGDVEWAKFIKRLQDLGVIKAVFVSAPVGGERMKLIIGEDSYAELGAAGFGASVIGVPGAHEGAAEEVEGCEG